MSSPWWWRLPDRPGDHHHLPPIGVFGLDWLLLFFGVSFKPWLLLWITWCYCVIPLTGRKEPCDVKPVASACLNRYQTPISSMITNLKQQKNWGETLKVWKKHNKIWIERSESSPPPPTQTFNCQYLSHFSTDSTEILHDCFLGGKDPAHRFKTVTLQHCSIPCSAAES